MCLYVVCSPVVVRVWLPYVGAVVAVTVMGCELFVLHVSIVRECQGARVTAMLVWVRIRCGCGGCRA